MAIVPSEFIALLFHLKDFIHERDWLENTLVSNINIVPIRVIVSLK